MADSPLEIRYNSDAGRVAERSKAHDWKSPEKVCAALREVDSSSRNPTKDSTSLSLFCVGLRRLLDTTADTTDTQVDAAPKVVKARRSQP